MTQYLPSNLLALFAPRDPIPFLPPVDKLPYEKRSTGYSGIAQYVSQFEDPAVNPVPKVETKEERREMKRRMKAEQVAYKLEQDIALWDPHHNPCATGNPYNTLFVARINYETTENNLLRNFGVYGPIRKIVLVKNNVSGQPRGYAFIEYEHEKDMHTAYKHADGKKLDSRRVLVDMERGRTIKGWLPRRLGGGIGGTRRGGPDVNVKHSSREQFLPDRHIGGGGGIKDRTIERDRGDRSERRRSRSRERRRRSRSRSRDRHRSDRRSKRDRSRERRDRGDRDASKADPSAEGVEGNGPEGGAEPPPRRERSRRSRSRDRKHRRSRSRDRKRRSERDRGDRESRRERRGGADSDASQQPPQVVIKQEPLDEDEVSRPANDEESASQQDQPSMDGFGSNYEGEYGNYNNNGEANEYGGEFF